MIVQLNSGLGNQMFQYAFGKALEKHYDCKVYFDTLSEYNIPHYRKLELKKFELVLNEASIYQLTKYLPLSSLKIDLSQFSFFYRLYYKVCRKLFKDKSLNLYRILFNKNIIEENTLCVYNDMYFKLDIYKNTYFKGYFQNEQFFKSIESSIRNDFKLKDDYLSDTELANKINIENSVSIHIRRGDYLDCKLFPTFDLNYYLEAIKLIIKNISNPIFYVFSDDIEWAKKNINYEHYHFRFVDEKFSENACDDLLLMSKCKHNIIANSTYSWWSAWLNSNRDKIVICPLKWYLDKEMNSLTQYMIPKQWIRI